MANYKRLIRDVIVAVLSAILTYLTSSCAGTLTIGKGNKSEQIVTTKVDSIKVNPNITIR